MSYPILLSLRPRERSPVSREAAAKEGKWIQSPSSPSFRASTGLDLNDGTKKKEIGPYRMTL